MVLFGENFHDSNSSASPSARHVSLLVLCDYQTRFHPRVPTQVSASRSKSQCRSTAATWMWQNLTNIYRIAAFRYADITMMVMIFRVFKTLPHSVQVPTSLCIHLFFWTDFCSEETIVVTMDGLGRALALFSYRRFLFFFKPGFHIVVSVVTVVSVVRKKFIGQIEFIVSRTTSCICRFFCIEHLYGRFP